MKTSTASLARWPAEEARELRDEVSQLPANAPAETLREYWSALGKISDELATKEPTDLEEIKAQRPQLEVNLPALKLSREEVQSRIEAAWSARAVGCLLGKPVEGWARGDIEGYLQDPDVVAQYGQLWPLSGYIPGNEKLHKDWKFHALAAERDSIPGAMPRDDDMDYPLIALTTLERVAKDRPGEAFTTDDFARTWRRTLPPDMTYTAERIAYENLMSGVDSQKAGSHANPYREWIGAQIRGDFFGYVNPGNPERAAERIDTVAA